MSPAQRCDLFHAWFAPVGHSTMTFGQTAPLRLAHSPTEAQVVLGDRDFVEKLKGMKNAVMKGSVKDQPSYRTMRSADPEALIKQAADYFPIR
jgi:hypothetical protein